MSFGREIKDFIGAWQAGEKIQQSGDDKQYKKLRNQYLQSKVSQATDPDYIQITKDRMKAQANYFNARANPDPSIAEGRNLTNRYRALQIDSILHPEKYQPAVPNAADSATPYAPPPGATPTAPAVAVPGPQSALDTQQPYDTADADDQDAQDTDMAASGGMITRKGYADGGAVNDDDDAPVVDDTPDQADISPADADAQDRMDAADDTDESDAGQAAPAAPQPNAKTLAYSPQAAHDAVVAGLKYAAKKTGHDGSPAPDAEGSAIPDAATPAAFRAKGSTKYLKGTGAASHTEMEAVKAAVDPENKMSESQRNMAALATVWEWNLKNNGAAGADAAAASMTQYMRVASDRYKAMMQVAASHGDIDGTMQMAMKAYANVPDGKDLKLTQTQDGKGIQATFTDDTTGKVVNQFIAPPEQMLQWATKGGLSTFDDLLGQSAAGRQELATKQAAADKAQTAKDKLANKGLKPGDSDKIDTAVDASIQDLPDQGASVKDQLPEVKGATFDVKVANPNISKGDALRTTLEMTQVDPANPKAIKFTPMGQVDGKFQYKLSNGKVVALPPDVAERLAALRAQNVLAATKKLDSAKASGARADQNISAAQRIMTPPSAPVPAPEALAKTQATLSNVGAGLTNPGQLSRDQIIADQRRRAARAGYVTQGALPVGQAGQ